VGVGPGGLGVHPDLVGAFAPQEPRQGDEAGARVALEVFGAADELDAGVVVVEVAGDGLEPEGSLEPPVAEELGVERRTEDGRDGVVEAGVERLPDEVDVVGGVDLTRSAASCG